VAHARCAVLTTRGWCKRFEEFASLGGELAEVGDEVGERAGDPWSFARASFRPGRVSGIAEACLGTGDGQLLESLHHLRGRRRRGRRDAGRCRRVRLTIELRPVCLAGLAKPAGFLRRIDGRPRSTAGPRKAIFNEPNPLVRRVRCTFSQRDERQFKLSVMPTIVNQSKDSGSLCIAVSGSSAGLTSTFSSEFARGGAGPRYW
jgi:hypothetical protein